MIELQWNMMMNKIEDIKYLQRWNILLHITTKNKQNSLTTFYWRSKVDQQNNPSDDVEHWVTRPDLETIFETKMVSNRSRDHFETKMSHYLEWRDWSRDHFRDQNGLDSGLETSIDTKMSHSGRGSKRRGTSSELIIIKDVLGDTKFQ